MATCVAAAVGSHAMATEHGMYIAPAYGFNKIDVDLAGLDTLFQSALALDFDSSSLDRSSRGLSLAVGYQFTPHLAVEGAWIDLGKLRYDFTFTDAAGPQAGRVTNRSSGMAFAGVGSLPLGAYFSLEARVGALFAENKLRLTDLATGDSGGIDDRNTALYFGVGATWLITPYTGIHAGFTRYDKGSFDEDVDQFSIGIRYSYGE